MPVKKIIAEKPTTETTKSPLKKALKSADTGKAPELEAETEPVSVPTEAPKKSKKVLKSETTAVAESIPTYPKLYILNNNNKIYEWSIEITPKDNGAYTVTTRHGEKDGKMVAHEKDITEGKVKRTILEQAILDANAKWKNKKEKELYTENLENTSTKPVIVRPMLANTFSFDLYGGKSKAFKISFPAYVQRKYDGIRCIAYLKDGNVVLESRKGLPFQNFNVLKDELTLLLNKLSPNFYFDGELYTDKLDFEVISGLIRLHEKKCTPNDLQLINKIEYHVYDFVDTENKDLPYSTRYNFLKDFLSKNTKSNSLTRSVETILVDKLEDVKTYHDEFVKNGYEGIMIRDMNGPYETNKRSKYLQKFKEFMEEEFQIAGFHEGTGDEKGAVIWDCLTKDNKTFAVRPKGTFESRSKLFNEANTHIGKQLTVIFQEYSADGIPRFPVGKGIRDIY